MKTLPAVTIDPDFLKVPDVNVGPKEIVQFIETLTDINDLKDEKKFSIFVGKTAQNTLICDDDSFLRLEKILKQNNSPFDYDTVLSVLLSIIQTTTIESKFNFNSISITSITTTPSITKNHSESLELNECIAYLTILCECCNNPHNEQILLVKGSNSNTIRVKLEVDKIDHSRDDLYTLPNTVPFAFNGSIQICGTCDEVIITSY